MVEIPEELLRRSAEARAAATGQPVDEVLAEMQASISGTGEQVESAPSNAEPEPPAISPDDLIEGEEEALAEADTAEPEVDEEPAAATSEPAEPEPEAEPELPAPAAVPAAGGEVDWAAAAAAAGMPEKLFKRSVEAKAKAKGVDASVVVAEMTGEPVPAAPAAAAPAALAAAAPAPAPAAAPVEAATIPKEVRPQRLLTVVKAKAIQQVKTTPTDKVSVWPHLLLIEFVALLAITALLIVMSVVIQAPLLEAANANVTPNPSKAPWYFLGLQELLTYFDPQIAGVTVPTIIGVIGFMAIPYIDRNPSKAPWYFLGLQELLTYFDPQIAGVTVPTIIGVIGFMAIPYIDRNPSNKPADRKFAIFMYTFFIMGSAMLTIIGTLFRGKGFNFSYPWTDGIFFDDLKDWITFE